MIKLFFILIAVFLNIPLLKAETCSCYQNSKSIRKIRDLISDYELFVTRRFYSSIPRPYDEWGRPYYQSFIELCNREKKINPGPLRFPDVQHNIIIYGQIIDLAIDYKFERNHQILYEKNAMTLEERNSYIIERNSVAMKDYLECKQKMQSSNVDIISEYVVFFEECSSKHSNLTTCHDYGMLAYLCNNFDKSLELLTKFIENAEETDFKNINEQVHHSLGNVCFEAMKYDKSIEYLTEAIQRDPSNKTLYFERALSYFETGNFDLAVTDYINSNYAKDVRDACNERVTLWERYKKIDPSIEFKVALFKGLATGASEAAKEFVPSMLNSMYGLGEALWAGIDKFNSVDKALESVHCFTAACYEVGENLVHFCKEVNWETVENSIDHIKKLYTQYDALSDFEKGELIGTTIGKYGIDALAPGAILKGAALIKNLKNANRICYLDKMATSSKNQEKISRVASKRFAQREAFFKKIKLDVDMQNKHIVGKHNFVETASIFEHPDPAGLLSKFKGTGIPVRGEVGCGYKEIVDFKEHVGIWRNLTTGEALPTTKGTIHYSKKSAHIVPAYPKSREYTIQK